MHIYLIMLLDFIQMFGCITLQKTRHSKNGLSQTQLHLSEIQNLISVTRIVAEVQAVKKLLSIGFYQKERLET